MYNACKNARFVCLYRHMSMAVLYSIEVLTRSTLCGHTYTREWVSLWECTVYLCFHGWVVAGLSYKPVKADLDGASWLSLDDPLTTQGVFVVAWPPRGEDDTRRPWVVAPTRSWRSREVEEWWEVFRGEERKAVLFLYPHEKHWKEINVSHRRAGVTQIPENNITR